MPPRQRRLQAQGPGYHHQRQAPVGPMPPLVLPAGRLYLDWATLPPGMNVALAAAGQGPYALPAVIPVPRIPWQPVEEWQEWQNAYLRAVNGLPAMLHGPGHGLHVSFREVSFSTPVVRERELLVAYGRNPTVPGSGTRPWIAAPVAQTWTTMQAPTQTQAVQQGGPPMPLVDFAATTGTITGRGGLWRPGESFLITVNSKRRQPAGQPTYWHQTAILWLDVRDTTGGGNGLRGVWVFDSGFVHPGGIGGPMGPAFVRSHDGHGGGRATVDWILEQMADRQPALDILPRQAAAIAPAGQTVQAAQAAGLVASASRILGGGNVNNNECRRMTQTWIQQTAVIVMEYILAVEAVNGTVALTPAQRAVVGPVPNPRRGRAVVEAWLADSVPYVR